MLLHILVAAWRNLLVNRLASFLAIIGLAIGITAALVSGLVVRSQLSFNHFIDGYDRTYLAVSLLAAPGAPDSYDTKTNFQASPLLQLNLPGIEASTRLLDEAGKLQRGDRVNEENIGWADPSLFKVLPMPVIRGDASATLRRPDGLVMTASLARKYFGRSDALGESLVVNGHPMILGAVLADFPSGETDLQGGIFASGLAAHSPLTRLKPDGPQGFSVNVQHLCPAAIAGGGGRAGAECRSRHAPLPAANFFAHGHFLFHATGPDRPDPSVGAARPGGAGAAGAGRRDRPPDPADRDRQLRQSGASQCAAPGARDRLAQGERRRPAAYPAAIPWRGRVVRPRGRLPGVWRQRAIAAFRQYVHERRRGAWLLEPPGATRPGSAWPAAGRHRRGRLSRHRHIGDPPGNNPAKGAACGKHVIAQRPGGGTILHPDRPAHRRIGGLSAEQLRQPARPACRRGQDAGHPGPLPECFPPGGRQAARRRRRGLQRRGLSGRKGVWSAPGSRTDDRHPLRQC